MTKHLCIFHSNCADGFAAAWVVWRMYGTGQFDFHPGVYGDAPPDVTDRHVVMVDFSYKRPVLMEMAAKAASILILDHHKTAAADLDGFWKPPARYEDFITHVAPALREEAFPPVNAIFDIDRSGAMITWDYFHSQEGGRTAPPKLLEHIQDRDLWLFKLEGTREIQANVFSYPYDFEVWETLMQTEPTILRAEGAAIERKHHKDIAELVGVSKRLMVIGGVEMPVANLPYTLSSDAGHAMAKGVLGGAAACYMDTPKGRVFSLRSSPDGIDVSEIAKRYGGGGHKNAAGFTMPIGWEGEQGAAQAAAEVR